MNSVFKENLINNPEPIENDKIIQLFQNEWYDQFAVFKSGRVFKKRARGQSGSYDNWVEVDIIKEIKSDLKI